MTSSEARGPTAPPPAPAVRVAEKLVLTVAEAIALTGIGETTISEAIADERLRAKMVGRHRHILRADLELWLQTLPDFEARERPSRIVQTQGPRRRG